MGCLAGDDEAAAASVRWESSARAWRWKRPF